MVLQIKAHNVKLGWFGNYCLVIKNRQVVKCYYGFGYDKNPKCKVDIDFSILLDHTRCRDVLKEHFIKEDNIIKP